MHGRYRSELSNYAREVAAAQRQKQVEDSRKRLEVRKQRRLKKESKFSKMNENLIIRLSMY